MAAKTKTEAKPQVIEGYEVQARGQYFAKDKSLKMYSLTFFIPREVEVQVRREWKWFKSGKSKIRRSVPVYDKVNGRENAQYIIQRLLLPQELTEKYPDAHAHKTCVLGQIKLAKRPAAEFSNITDKEIGKMTRAELVQFCSLHSLSTPIDSFSDIADARQAVQDSYDAQIDLGAPAEADSDLEVAADTEADDPDMLS